MSATSLTPAVPAHLLLKPAHHPVLFLQVCTELADVLPLQSNLGGCFRLGMPTSQKLALLLCAAALQTRHLQGRSGPCALPMWPERQLQARQTLLGRRPGPMASLTGACRANAQLSCTSDLQCGVQPATSHEEEARQTLLGRRPGPMASMIGVHRPTHNSAAQEICRAGCSQQLHVIG